jgi:hypothetical protein
MSSANFCCGCLLKPGHHPACFIEKRSCGCPRLPGTQWISPGFGPSFVGSRCRVALPEFVVLRLLILGLHLPILRHLFRVRGETSREEEVDTYQGLFRYRVSPRIFPKCGKPRINLLATLDAFMTIVECHVRGAFRGLPLVCQCSGRSTRFSGAQRKIAGSRRSICCGHGMRCSRSFNHLAIPDRQLALRPPSARTSLAVCRLGRMPQARPASFARITRED